jgi:hypothetical protein
VEQVHRARVTNPTAAGRFLVAGGFTSLLLIFPHRTGAVQNWFGRNAQYMSPFGCRPAAFVAQSGMGTTIRPDCLRFSQRSLAGAWLLAPRTICAAARSPYSTILHRPISQSSSAKRVIRHCEFSEKFGILEKHQYQMLQLKMHGF